MWRWAKIYCCEAYDQEQVPSLLALGSCREGSSHMHKKKMASTVLINFGLMLASVSIAAVSTGASFQTAILHTLLEDRGSHSNSHHHAQHHGHHGKGCFITTSPQNHARGIRHWVSPCPHRELNHMNPYHSPHHKMHYHPETDSHHRHHD